MSVSWMHDHKLWRCTMNYIDIACTKSITFSKYCMGENNQLLQIGEWGTNVYWSYLYFDLNVAHIHPIDENDEVQLILYKIPHYKTACQEEHEDEAVKKLVIMPTTVYMSPYTYYYDTPHLMPSLMKECEVNRRSAYTVIDITKIVKAWLEGEIENKGIVIFNKNAYMYVQYASSTNKLKELRPFLHIKHHMFIT